MSKYEEIIAKLRKKGIMFDKGLSGEEIEEVEKYYDINMPESLKELYKIALPVSNSFYNWRDFSADNVEKIKSMLEWPLEGTLFDIENNDFWDSSWGRKPDNINEAKEVCIKKFKDIPKLVPICSHRYIPYLENNMNPAVLSVYQTDVIYYGRDLINYLQIEFLNRQYNSIWDFDFEDVPFWGDLEG